MYSSESGIDTDNDAQRKVKLELLEVIPNKAQYNTNERIALIFNKNLSNKGSYQVEFKGKKRSKMEVKAEQINKCTLVVEAPVYHPVEKVRIHVRHRTHEGSRSVGEKSFEFLSRDSILASILQDYCGDPVTFMCESLGISPVDITALDDALAVTFKRNMPPGLHLLGLHNSNIENEACNSLHPTLLHFAAAFGLFRLTKDCLLHCPGAVEASKLRNCRGEQPDEIATNGGFSELAEEIIMTQGKAEDSIYEPMTACEDPSYYTKMGCINLVMWPGQPGDVTSPTVEDSPNLTEEGKFYEDMTRNEDRIDKDGYIEADRPDVKHDEDGLYMPMTDAKQDDGHYVDVEKREYDTEGGDDQGLYEAMGSDTGIQYQDDHHRNPTYDTPTSNLPVSDYPEIRSASMSYNPKSRKPKRGKKSPPPKEDAPPAAPPRLFKEQRSSLQRTGSTGSRTSVTSGHSQTSATSTSTTGSGFDGDIEEEDGDHMMSRKELIAEIEATKLGPVPPPPPPADYEHEQQLQTTQKQNVVSPRTTRRHGDRPKTMPVSPSDIKQAQDAHGRSYSLQETRPLLTTRPISELSSHTKPQAPQAPQVPTRRISDDVVNGRPPAKIPSQRPLASGPPVVPRGPPRGVAEHEGLPSQRPLAPGPPIVPRGPPRGVATPFALAAADHEEEPPPPPAREYSAIRAPPVVPRRGK